MKTILCIGLILFPLKVIGQTAFLDDTIATHYIRKGINHIYNLEFAESDFYLDSLSIRYPEHPAIPFYQGMQHYWANYPVPQGGELSNQFVEYIEASIERAGELLVEDRNDIEGVFFDLAARSFLVMYYADNGYPAKCFPHLGNVYRQLMKSFELEDQFVEFYFFTGLYNYYIDAYPEAHPVYKPVTRLFKSGNKETGLKSLDYAVHNAHFMRVEALHFISIIYFGFEHNYKTALAYTKQLWQMFPNNYYFYSRYIEMIIVNGKFDEAKPHIDSLFESSPYYRMKAKILLGLYEEGLKKDYEAAKKLFLKGIEEAEPYGDYAGYTVAYAYTGMSRYYQRKGDRKQSREYHRMAKSTNAYPHVYEINKLE